MTKLILVIAVLTLLLPSCEEKEKIVEVPVVTDCPPSAPQGVFAYNMDGYVSICWYPNPENDIEGYDVYYGEQPYGDYYYIGTVWAVYPDPGEYCYNDTTGWGEQWYYAVAAFDEGGYESDLSYDIVSGTPRPEGVVTLYDVGFNPDRSGFDLSDLDNSAQPYDLGSTDFYYDGGQGVFELIARPGVDIQDYGYVDDFYIKNYAPAEGWSPTGGAEVIFRHCYMLRLDPEPGGYHYAKVYVTEVTADLVTILWAYQTDPGNPDLMPAPGESGDGGNIVRKTSGRSGEKKKIKHGFRVGRQFPPSYGEGNIE